VYRARDGSVEHVELGGLILGVVPDLADYVEEVQISLEPGDQVLLYTDGVTEGVDTERRQFGLERLSELLRRCGGEPPARLVNIVIEALEHHARGALQHDDITLLAIRRPR
jgi:sigma-B regulation protein RsbU (phosphoserine phosphatase)